MTDHERRLREFEECCRRHGLAVTIQRRAIFEVLLGRCDHPTADQVYAHVRPKLARISRATVYRVLETLARIGAISKACHTGAAARYDPRVVRHHHLVCLGCDKVVDFEDARLDNLPVPRGRDGFRIHDVSVHCLGLCPECRREAGRRPTRKTRKSARKER